MWCVLHTYQQSVEHTLQCVQGTPHMHFVSCTFGVLDTPYTEALPSHMQLTHTCIYAAVT